jgi:hypothetical protein
MAGIKGEYIYDEDGNIIGATGGKLTALNNIKRHGADYYSKLGTRGAAVKAKRTESLKASMLTGNWLVEQVLWVGTAQAD